MNSTIFLAFGFLWSGFFGYYALDFLGGVKPEDTKWKVKRPCTPGVVYQVLLNFLGSAAGWVALYYFWFHRVRDSIVANKPLGATDVAIAVFAVVGVMGFLPFTASKISKLP